MSWTLDPLAPAGAEVSRLLQEQVQLAVEALGGPDPDRGVHEARKAGKRARALLRAAEGMLPEPARRAELRRLRDAARCIAPSRDAAVRLRTFDRIARDTGPELRAVLAQEAAQVHAEPQALAQARAAFAAGGPLVLDGGWDELIEGIAACYRRGRQRFPADAGAAPERFHAWRRSAKDHLYHLQALRSAWPAVFDGLAQEADRLQDELGQHQDLCVLEGWLAARTGPDDAELHRRLRRRASRLRRRALQRGGRVFAMPPRALAAWLRALLAVEPPPRRR